MNDAVVGQRCFDVVADNGVWLDVAPSQTARDRSVRMVGVPLARFGSADRSGPVVPVAVDDLRVPRYHACVTTRPAELSPELHDAVERARMLADADGELRPLVGAYESPLPTVVQDALDQILRDGTYDEAVAAVIAEDPELA